jgi:hypothetical protein
MYEESSKKDFKHECKRKTPKRKAEIKTGIAG